MVGPLHFTVYDNKLTYYCQKCMTNPNNKNQLPKVCYAIKAQIDKLEQKEWKDLGIIDI